MRAIEITATGGADVLVLHDVPEPVAGPRQAVVRVEAAGVNFIDVYVREGRYPAQLPLVPGQEAAGTVVAVGDGVTTVKAGDRDDSKKTRSNPGRSNSTESVAGGTAQDAIDASLIDRRSADQQRRECKRQSR